MGERAVIRAVLTLDVVINHLYAANQHGKCILQITFRVCLKNPLIRNFGGAVPFLRHKVRLSAAKPSGFFLELTQNPLELADCSA